MMKRMAKKNRKSGFARARVSAKQKSVEILKRIVRYASENKIAVFLKYLYEGFILAEYRLLSLKWFLQGGRLPDKKEQEAVIKNVTFIYKSFERQGMAKRLAKNIQRYYPGVKIIIADDSQIPLKIKTPHVEVLNLPFNSGLSYGLNRALEKVTTPYTIRIDDDMLLTPFTRFHEQLLFLKQHEEIDLSAVQACSAPFLKKSEDRAKEYFPFSMSNAPKQLLIKHMTPVDDNHIVSGKTPNVFIIKTESFRAIGYDDNIRMIDHNDFFMRAAGNIVSAMDLKAFVFHYHNRFDRHYEKYRSDWKRDWVYIQSRNKKGDS